MKCPECGATVASAEQKFCENCGAKLTREQSSTPSSSTPSSSQSYEHTDRKAASNAALPAHRDGGLFDLNRNYYVLKEKYWDWGGGDILDQNSNVIGKMKRKILSIRRKVELREVDGTTMASIHSKLISLRGAQDLKDPQGNMIARIKKKFLSFFRPKFFLEDPEGNRWYEAQGKFMGFSFKVTDVTTGEVVAEIEKADRWRDVFLGGLLDYKDTYALRILDNVTDRRILLGFVLSIDNVLHDTR
ncbi:MAG: hypothetical protein BAJALOKI2v1_50004 [Promethearchaeota archaeon]|nr:MAG: hypothetical protein BAJALOKI2v1_50004 [Candidatus Lokiarchaeota archaeon]